MKKLLSHTQGRMWGGVTKMRGFHFLGCYLSKLLPGGYKENGFCEKLKKEDITLVEMRLCSVHIIFMAV